MNAKKKKKIPLILCQNTPLFCFVLISSEVVFFLKLFKHASVFPQAPNSSESPGTSRTEHSDLLEEEEDERSDIKVKKLKYPHKETL